jgi:hypothetical protein
MTTFHVLKVNANFNILEIGLTYLLAVIIEAILKLTEPVKAEEDLCNLCNQILESHDSIRSVGIPNKMDK